MDFEDDLDGAGVTSGGDGGPTEVRDTNATEPQVDPSRKALIEEWIGRIQRAKTHHGKAFKRMDYCMQIAAEGAEDEWVDGKNYVVHKVFVSH